jgi:uncharacterized lipoprotein
MKNIFLLAFAVLFTGCSAQYPLTTNLKLQVNSQSPGIYSNATSAFLKGHDARKNPAIAVYRLKDKPEIEIPNQNAPHIVITQQLAIGLMEQGLVFESSSPVRIRLDINELVASVTRPNVLYNTTAKSNLTLTIHNKEISLTKTYDRQANSESATHPKVLDIEKILAEQLSDIVNQILHDEEIQTAIGQK